MDVAARWGVVGSSSVLLGLGSLNSGTMLGTALGALLLAQSAACFFLALRHRRIA
jgi:uncharacterized membrane protein HdeD (DUF308 family)